MVQKWVRPVKNGVKVIDRRIRELRVHCEIFNCQTSLDVLKKYKAIIISGGPSSVHTKSENAPNLPKEIFELNIPILGICWGMQYINFIQGGEVSTLSKREDGVFDIDITPESPIFKDAVFLRGSGLLYKIWPESIVFKRRTS